MRGPEPLDDGMVLRRVPHIGELADPELLACQRGKLLALGAADAVRRLLRARSDGPRVQADYAEVHRPVTERDIPYGARARDVMGAHAGLGEVDHDLVELPAGGSDVVVFHCLGKIDDAHPVPAEAQGIDRKQGEDQVQGEGSGARHAAAGDVAQDDGIEALPRLQPLAAQDVIDAPGESGPRLCNFGGARRGNGTGAELDDPFPGGSFR